MFEPKIKSHPKIKFHTKIYAFKILNSFLSDHLTLSISSLKPPGRQAAC